MQSKWKMDRTVVIHKNSAQDCIFCKIIKREIPAKIVHEDDDLIVFHDISPKAKLHLLVVPKDHIASLAHADPANSAHSLLLGTALVKLNEIAKQNNATNGFRTIINTGRGGGQVVDHIHIHLLAGDLPAFG